MTSKSSSITGFYKLSVEERLQKLKDFAGLSDDEVKTLKETGLKIEQANRMIENVVGTLETPLGVATNFRINSREYLIPMAIEEPSVVAAASNAAKMSLAGGGFRTSSTEPVMIGQIQVTDVKDALKKAAAVDSRKKELIELANKQDPVLVKFGGGARDVQARVIKTSAGDMLIVHLLVDVRDAMGANAVNTMCEKVAPLVEEITGGRVCLRIISNYAVHRLARAEAVFTKEALGGEDVVDGILKAYAFAEADVFRAVTHNKGVMNGITAVVLASGNDTRAIEAGAHAYASKSGVYKPLTLYSKDKDGNLVGRIELPMALGLVGGATAVHPVAKIVVKILEVRTACELSEVVAAVGLAQNLAALKALATEGIQRGHMSLHARNIAVTAGAVGGEVDKVAELMVKEKNVRMDRAKTILEELRKTQ